MEWAIDRRIDELGRVVIPIELRKALKLETGQSVEMRLEEGRIVLIPVPVGKEA